MFKNQNEKHSNEMFEVLNYQVQHLTEINQIEKKNGLVENKM